MTHLSLVGRGTTAQALADAATLGGSTADPTTVTP